MTRKGLSTIEECKRYYMKLAEKQNKLLFALMEENEHEAIKSFNSILYGSSESRSELESICAELGIEAEEAYNDKYKDANEMVDNYLDAKFKAKGREVLAKHGVETKDSAKAVCDRLKINYGSFVSWRRINPSMINGLSFEKQVELYIKNKRVDKSESYKVLCNELDVNYNSFVAWLGKQLDLPENMSNRGKIETYLKHIETLKENRSTKVEDEKLIDERINKAGIKYSTLKGFAKRENLLDLFKLESIEDLISKYLEYKKVGTGKTKIDGALDSNSKLCEKYGVSLSNFYYWKRKNKDFLSKELTKEEEVKLCYESINSAKKEVELDEAEVKETKKKRTERNDIIAKIKEEVAIRGLKYANFYSWSHSNSIVIAVDSDVKEVVDKYEEATKIGKGRRKCYTSTIKRKCKSEIDGLNKDTRFGKTSVVTKAAKKRLLETEVNLELRARERQAAVQKLCTENEISCEQFSKWIYNKDGDLNFLAKIYIELKADRSNYNRIGSRDRTGRVIVELTNACKDTRTIEKLCMDNGLNHVNITNFARRKSVQFKEPFEQIAIYQEHLAKISGKETLEDICNSELGGNVRAIDCHRWCAYNNLAGFGAREKFNKYVEFYKLDRNENKELEVV